MTPRSLARLAACLLLLGCVAGCSGTADERANDGADVGDCVARVLYAGDPYFPRGRRAARIAGTDSLGDAEIVGCQEEPTGIRVEVFAVRGVSPEEAVVVVGGDYRSLYVREDLARDEWSAALARVAASS